MELKQLKREVLYTGRTFDLLVDHVEYPSGNTAIREIAHHPGGAVVVPLLDDGRVILVSQLRYPFGKHIMELPAGKINPGEAPEATAIRELEEETGWIAGTLEKLAVIYTTPGFCDEELHIYLATGLRESHAGHKREEGELTMTVHILPLGDILKMIDSDEIHDSKTIVGVLMTERKLLLKQ